MVQRKIVVLHKGDMVYTDQLTYIAADNGLEITGYNEHSEFKQMLVIPVDNSGDKAIVLHHHDTVSYQGEGHVVVEGTPDSHVLVWSDELALALNDLNDRTSYIDTSAIKEGA